VLKKGEFTMKSTISILAALVLCLSVTTSAQDGSIKGKLWVVSYEQAANVTFPPPSATPDATFSTNGIAYIGQQPNNCYTIGTFIAKCSTAAYNLRFSGEYNPYSGGVVGPSTPMSGGRGRGGEWGVMIEFTGKVSLSHGQKIYIVDDDGVALEIDGNLIPGFPNGVTGPNLNHEMFHGSTGQHSFDLLYANAQGGGAWLLFFPELY
jgi:hypothetical protein